MRGKRARLLRQEYQPPGRGREIQYRILKRDKAGNPVAIAAVAIPETRRLYQEAKREWNRRPRPDRRRANP